MPITLSPLASIAVIVVAIFDIVLLFILVVIAYVILRLILTLRSEIMPVLGTVKRTTTTVEGTTDFISTTVATPLIRAVALIFATSRFFQVLFSRGGSRS